MSRVAAPLKCKENEIIELNELANSNVYSADMNRRAKIILLANEGKTNKEIAGLLNSNENTVSMWRNRFLKNRVLGLKDLDRPGRRGSKGNDKRQAVVEAAVQSENISIKDLATQAGTSEATARRALKDAGISLDRKRSYEVKASLLLDKVCVDIKGLFVSDSALAIVMRIDRNTSKTMDEGILSTRNKELADESGDDSSLSEILDKMRTCKKKAAVKEIRLDEFLQRMDDSLDGVKHVAVIRNIKYKIPSGLIFKNIDIIATADVNSWFANVSMCFHFMSEGNEGTKLYNSLVKYIQSRENNEESLVWTRRNLVFTSVPSTEIEKGSETENLFADNSASTCAWVKYGYATKDGDYAEFYTIKYDVLPEKSENVYGDPYRVASYTGDVVAGVRSLFSEPQKQLAEEYMNQNSKKKQARDCAKLKQ